MSAFSDYLEDSIINAVFRGTTFPAAPANVYVALFTAAPSDSGGGTEVTGGSYTRVAVTTSGGWAATSGGNGRTYNLSTISFPTATATWGTIVAFGIFDASTNGNLLFYGNLVFSRAVNNGDSVLFQAGQLQITVA